MESPEDDGAVAEPRVVEEIKETPNERVGEVKEAKSIRESRNESTKDSPGASIKETKENSKLMQSATGREKSTKERIAGLPDGKDVSKEKLYTLQQTGTIKTSNKDGSATSQKSSNVDDELSKQTCVESQSESSNGIADERPTVHSLVNIMEDIQPLGSASNLLNMAENTFPGAYHVTGWARRNGSRSGSSSTIQIGCSLQTTPSQVRIDSAHLVALDEENALVEVDTEGSFRSTHTELVEGRVIRAGFDKQGHWIGWCVIFGCAAVAVVLMVVFLGGR
ncbi:expressed unknown protein [Seminavis robusta]|uniref:Uncharacterized protein n=1 Tax=Seminavis robusta TaxID=568900 RepID=A0A9N8EUL2_9STRA|nr:expressed unknown protein [Seminavis robusta]|eukprot:Sro2010_g310780.1 n/a (279) ;mRNA; f:3247-4083